MIDSLYFRLNLTAMLVLVVFFGATGAVLDSAYESSARQSLRERMLGQVYQLMTASEIDDGGHLVMPLSTRLPFAELALPDSGLYAYVGSNGNPQPLWRSPSLLYRQIPVPFPLQVGEQRWTELTLDNGSRVFALGFGFQRSVKAGVLSVNFYLLAEAAPLAQQVAQYRSRLWGGLAGAALLLLATQLWLLRWGLSPLRKVGRELNAIETGSSEKIEGRYPREVRHLTDNINTLLSQERARQTRYRNALADLAHSLKTPLAVLLSTGEQGEELAATVSEQGTRMMRIVERQLQRAGAASHSRMQPALALQPLAERLGTSLCKVYRDKNVLLINDLDPDVCLRLDESDLIEILGNLLDNAFKWCDRRVEITASKAGHRLVVSIDDDGPGIAGDLIGHILQRGGRADESIPGHGIGLSVVAEIVEAYRGRLDIQASRLGGAMVRVTFDD